MRTIHTVPAISEEASGPSYSVMRLCESLMAEGENVTLAALDWAPVDSPPAFLKRFPLGLGPRRLGRSPAMYRWLREEVASGRVDLIHNHGMWYVSSAYPGWVTKHTATNLVTSPRGAFSTWAMQHGSPMKRIFWPILQRPALYATTCFHATAESEYKDIRRLGFRQPVAIIPNGIDIPECSPKQPDESRTLLFLGRIHPVKGLDMLLPAWGAVQERFPEWQLKIVGSDFGYYGESGYLNELRTLVSRLKLNRVEFVGELRGREKLQAYRDADLFVLPTYSENFGLTVAEALAAGSPAIVSKGAPWEDLDKNGCGWWIDVGIDPLVACLEEAMALSSEACSAKGMHGRNWMIEEFSWSWIGRMMDQTYRWLNSGGTVPNWIRLD
ncbi:MAG TPA: glycosyltransferase [Bacteriovoracaceae bacterium]|nr:glycosyltransferase [Bacteriovoracaceae bacterium]